MITRRESNKKVKKSQFIKVGSLVLIILGVSIFGFRFYQSYNKNKIEDKKVEEFIDEQRNLSITDIINASNNSEDTSRAIKSKTDYIAVLEIPKINFKRGIYEKDSKENDVDKNIKLLKESNMPNEENGNFILAGHSGTARNAYFRNLKKLDDNDIAYVYYNGARYGYNLVNKYEIDKTGTANISRNGKKNTLTLITCKDNSNKQIVFIFELMEDGE